MEFLIKLFGVAKFQHNLLCNLFIGSGPGLRVAWLCYIGHIHSILLSITCYLHSRQNSRPRMVTFTWTSLTSSGPSPRTRTSSRSSATAPDRKTPPSARRPKPFFFNLIFNEKNLDGRQIKYFWTCSTQFNLVMMVSNMGLSVTQSSSAETTSYIKQMKVSVLVVC